MARNYSDAFIERAEADGDDQYTGFDCFGRVIDQFWLNTAGPTTTERMQYGYDRDGNVLYKKDLVTASNSELYHNNSSTSGDNATAYDALGRLSAMQVGTLSSSGNNGSSLDTVSSASFTWGVSLGALGTRNTATVNGTTTTNTFNSQNQQTAYGSNTLVYDNDGNMTTDQNGNTYVYDMWGRTTQAAGGNLWTYDALNRLIALGGSFDPQLYYSADGRVLTQQQKVTVGCCTVTDVDRLVWGQGYIDDLILRDDSGGTRIYAQQDANANVVTLTDNSGSVLTHISYDPDGNVRSGSPGTYNWIYLFQGLRQTIADSGGTATTLYYARNRFFNAGLGIWMQPDPGGYAMSGSNLFQAFGSNSESLVDPSGLDVVRFRVVQLS